jgi:hypothetical protein
MAIVNPFNEAQQDALPACTNFYRPLLWYPRALARRSIRGNLRPVLGQPLLQAFAAHGRLVQNSVRRALAELSLAFDSCPGACQDQLAGSISQGAAKTEEMPAHDSRQP